MQKINYAILIFIFSLVFGQGELFSGTCHSVDQVAEKEGDKGLEAFKAKIALVYKAIEDNLLRMDVMLAVRGEKMEFITKDYTPHIVMADGHTHKKCKTWQEITTEFADLTASYAQHKKLNKQKFNTLKLDFRHWLEGVAADKLNNWMIVGLDLCSLEQ